MTPNEIKLMLGMTDNTKDAYLEEVIPLFIEWAKDYCKNKFLVNEVEILPGGVKIFVSKAVEFNIGDTRLASRSMDTVSYSYNTDFPQTIKDYLKPYRRLSW